MSDRELLELAAKAAGVELKRWREDVNAFLLKPDFATGIGINWNPLTDDGDALRLAVRLHIDLEWQDAYNVEAYKRSEGAHYCAAEQATMGYGIEEATRRAIVRAAAAIGKEMP